MLALVEQLLGFDMNMKAYRCSSNGNGRDRPLAVLCRLVSPTAGGASLADARPAINSNSTFTLIRGGGGGGHGGGGFGGGELAVDMEALAAGVSAGVGFWRRWPHDGWLWRKSDEFQRRRLRKGFGRAGFNKRCRILTCFGRAGFGRGVAFRDGALDEQVLEEGSHSAVAASVVGLAAGGWWWGSPFIGVGFDDYGWGYGGGSCYWNCRQFYGPGYCRSYAWNFCY